MMRRPLCRFCLATTNYGLGDLNLRLLHDVPTQLNSSGTGCYVGCKFINYMGFLEMIVFQMFNGFSKMR